jgi:hypothetical protein
MINSIISNLILIKFVILKKLVEFLTKEIENLDKILIKNKLKIKE